MDAAILTANIHSQPDQMELVRQIAGLDERRDRGETQDPAYEQRRALLKA